MNVSRNNIFNNLYKFLRAITVSSQYSQRKMQSLKPIIGSAGAMLLKARNTQVSAGHHLIGLSLFLGWTRKRVSFKTFIPHFPRCMIAIVKFESDIVLFNILILAV